MVGYKNLAIFSAIYAKKPRMHIRILGSLSHL